MSRGIDKADELLFAASAVMTIYAASFAILMAIIGAWYWSLAALALIAGLWFIQLNDMGESK